MRAMGVIRRLREPGGGRLLTFIAYATTRDWAELLALSAQCKPDGGWCTRRYRYAIALVGE